METIHHATRAFSGNDCRAVLLVLRRRLHGRLERRRRSRSYKTAPEKAMYAHGAWDFHSNLELIAHSDPKPLRIFINANDADNGAGQGAGNRHDWLLANQRTAAALKSQGVPLSISRGQRRWSLRPKSLRCFDSGHAGPGLARLCHRVAGPNGPHRERNPIDRHTRPLHKCRRMVRLGSTKRLARVV